MHNGQRTNGVTEDAFTVLVLVTVFFLLRDWHAWHRGHVSCDLFWKQSIDDHLTHLEGIVTGFLRVVSWNWRVCELSAVLSA